MSLDHDPVSIGARLGFGADGRRGSTARRRATRDGLRRADFRAAEGGSPRMAERVEGGRGLPSHLAGAVVALGNFDGFHLGHQAVVARAVELARSRGVPTVVATFDPHPVRHFRPEAAPFRLSSLDQRRRLLGPAGVDALMVCAFDGDLAALSPEAFVGDWLRGASGVVTGEGYRFGRARAGDVRLLAELSTARGMTCATATAVELDGTTVSSTRVREALRAGDCAAAARLLTRPYAIGGVLRPGIRSGGGLSFVDGTLALGDSLRPRAGVYAVRARLLGRVLGGSAYLAANGDALELFLVDLADADMGRPIAVELVAHLHDAQATYDAPALNRRIALDRVRACDLIGNPRP